MLNTLGTAFWVAFDQLRVNTLRTILSTLGVIIGVGALVAVLSLADGMEAFSRGQVERFTDVQTVSIASRTAIYEDGVWIPVRDIVTFGPREAQDIRRDVAHVKDVALSVGAVVPVASPRWGHSRETNVTAAMAGFDDFNHSDIESGRFYSRVEDERGAPVVILSHKLAVELAQPRAPEYLLGETVRVNGAPRQVIGLLAAYKGERGFGAIIPYSSVNLLKAEGRRLLPTLAVRAPRVEDVDMLHDELLEWVAKRYQSWQGRIEVRTQEQRLEQTTQAFRIFRFFMGAIAGISLLVGGIGIMNVMLASVSERTREIGVRKAIGARRQDVLLQFLSESVAISSVGSAIGTMLGASIAVLATYVVRTFTGAEELAPSFTFASIAVAAGSAVLIGLLFGTYPARRAARLSPIDAIRHD